MRIELEVRDGYLIVYLIQTDDQGEIILSESAIALSKLQEK